MSLLDVRRDRKASSGGPTRPPKLWKQILTLAVILYLIWNLNQLV
jgi:hypothetical protein